MTINPTQPLRLYFIRHGETAWSLSGQHSGRVDLPLTPRGETEAQAVGKRLRGIPFTHVLTSPLQRARQTCALAALGPTAELEPKLAEWDNGTDEGRTSAEILESRPGWNLFLNGSPNGESPAQISDRADSLIAQLRELAGNVALFSHSHFGRVLAARWIGLPVAQAQHLLLNTASVSVLCYEHGRTDQPAIAVWNSSATEILVRAADAVVGNGILAKRRAIDRWENEGGVIPKVWCSPFATAGSSRAPSKRHSAFDRDGPLKLMIPTRIGN